MTRQEFKTSATKVLTVARVLASFSETKKDDQVVDLLSHLFYEAEHFNTICDLLNLPKGASDAAHDPHDVG